MDLVSKWTWSVLLTWPVYADLASQSGPGQPKWRKVMLTLPAKVDLDSQSGQVGGLDRDPKGTWTAKVAQSMVFWTAKVAQCMVFFGREANFQVMEISRKPAANQSRTSGTQIPQGPWTV